MGLFRQVLARLTILAIWRRRQSCETLDFSILGKILRLVTLLLLAACSLCRAESEATYLANSGLMVTDGDTKILFDPLFRNNYSQYLLVPAEMERDMMAGVPPFDGVDAIFVSHFHGDHFAPAEVLDYLRAQPGVKLYAPRQAVDELRFFMKEDESSLAARVASIDIDYGEPVQIVSSDNLLVEAFHIPHSGWPDRKPEVQNLAFRVTLNDRVTVLHMGDADTDDAHFTNDGDQWAARDIDMAFPPYWYFLSSEGRAVLEDRLSADLAIGVHVPGQLPSDLAEGLQDYDLFHRPGETRKIVE